MTKQEKIILVFIFGFLFLLNIYFGKDINWDQMNYHLYGVHLLLENRWEQDYFAGSFQGYLNPISYIPFYWMVQQGWHPVLISSSLLAVHFLNVVFIFLIVKRISPSISAAGMFLVLGLSVSAPIFLTVLGTSFNDATCSVLIVAALYVYLRQAKNCYVWMGVLCGISLAFKLTQAIYILTFIGLIFAFDKQKIKSVFIYGCVTGIVFLILHSAWGWHLQREFGSPLFPLFNDIFQSSDFFKESYHDSRFMGDYWIGAITIPFEMILPQSWVYTESENPDLRIAACFVIFVFYFSYLLRKKTIFIYSREETKIIFFFFVSFLLWALLSRIGRYAVTSFLMAGPVIYVLLGFLGKEYKNTLSLSLVLLAQVFLLVSIDFKKWSPHDWGDQWMRVEIPEVLQKEKALFVVVNTQSASYLSMHLHPDSGFVNLIGQYNIPYKDGLPEKFIKLKNKFDKKYVVLFTDGSGSIDDFLDGKNKILKNYGFLSSGECLSGSVRENYAERFELKQPMYQLHFCHLKDVSEKDRMQQVQESTKYDYIFEYIEKNCNKFGPKNPATLTDGKTWIRQYVGTISSIYVEKGGVFAHGHRILHPAYLGDIENITKKNGVDICPDIYRKRYLY